MITEDGVAAAACRYLDVPTTGIDVQLGLGSRHVSAAGASKLLHIFVVVLSQGGVTRIYVEAPYRSRVDALPHRLSAIAHLFSSNAATHSSGVAKPEKTSSGSRSRRHDRR